MITLASTQLLDSFLAGIERKAYCIAMIATNNREDALDIVQDAMFKLVQRYRDRQETEWPPLFYRILKNRIQDWARRRKVRHYWQALSSFGQEDVDDQVENMSDKSVQQPLEQIANTNAVEQFVDALRHLPFRQQQVVLLRAWEGLNVAQTAQAMGCSTGSVKTHYSRALHKLRDLLEDHWP